MTITSAPTAWHVVFGESDDKTIGYSGPFFAATAIAIAGLTLMSQVPHPLIPVDLPTVNIA